MRRSCCLITFLICLSVSLGAQTAAFYQTTPDLTQKLKQGSSVTFGSTGSAPKTIPVDDTKTYQQVEGFGASLTDSAAWLIYNKLTEAQRAAAMQLLFDRQNGIALSFLRQPMGASDLALNFYTYDDMPSGQKDPSLANFSIAHDEAYILPVLRQAIALNPNVKVMATPWSPPAWMKNTDSLCGVANGTNSSLRSDAYQPLANYFVKFIQAYGAAGVKVDYVSLQNEPLYPPPGYTGMLMSSSEQKSLLNSYIAPAFRSANISAKVLLYDHNWDNSSYPNSLISDATTRANAAGVAWHHYGGDPATMTTVHDSSPELGHWVTEASGGDWQTGNILAEEGTELVKVMRNWSKAYVLWSMAQDQDRGPYATTSLGLHGCNNCRGVLKIAWDKAGTGAASVVTPELDYYVLGHASKFVKPGAVRIDSDQTVPSVSNVAFRNPDGSVVLYIANSTSTDSTFNVKYRGKFVTITVKSGSVATLVWTPETTPAISLVPENTGMRFASGRTGSLGMAVQPVSGTPTVSFGCAVVDASGATTTKASCSVWPSNMSFSDSSTQSAVLSVNSGSATVAKKTGSMRLVAMFTIGAAGACVVFSRHSRFAWLVAMFLLFTAVSCGGSGGASTPITPTPASVAGTYFATVTATTDAGAPVNLRIQVLVE